MVNGQRSRSQPAKRRVPVSSSRSKSSRSIPPPAVSVAGAIGAAAAAPSWYLANFASTAGQSGSDDRRTARYALRSLNRQPGVSALPRPAACGTPIGASHVAIHRSESGVSHMSGLETCGSVWACPVCSAKIRNYRADEISRAFSRHIDKGGGAALVTLTLPHGRTDPLRRLAELVSAGFRAVVSGRQWVEDRDACGILGQIRAFEITHGENGWHPHLHVLMCTEAPLTAAAADALQARLQARWNRWLHRQGWRLSADGIGVRVDRVRRNAAAVGVYIAKLQEGSMRTTRVNVASEIARSDLKQARGGGRVPFEILADFGSDGVASDLDLWHEYQLATKGRSAVRWSRGLRALLLPDEPELTDQEVVDEDQAAPIIAYLTAPAYRQLLARPYGEAYLLRAAELGGLPGIRRFTRSVGIDPRGVLSPDSLMPVNYIIRGVDHE